MNKRLRRINRALRLRWRCFLRLPGYIIYDTVNFGPQKQEIQTLLTDYLTTLPELNQLPEEYREFGKAVPEGAPGENSGEQREFTRAFTYSSAAIILWSICRNLLSTPSGSRGKGEGFFLDGKVIIREIAVQKQVPPPPMWRRPTPSFLICPRLLFPQWFIRLGHGGLARPLYR